MIAPKLTPKALELLARLEAKEKAKARDEQAEETPAPASDKIVGMGENPLDVLDGAKL